MLAALRPRGAPPLHHQPHREVSDLLEVLLLQKECGLLHGTLDDRRSAT
jgi:hypothetical protein